MSCDIKWQQNFWRLMVTCNIRLHDACIFTCCSCYTNFLWRRDPTSAQGCYYLHTGHLYILSTSSSKHPVNMHHLSWPHLKAKVKGDLKKPKASKTSSLAVSPSANIFNVGEDGPLSPPDVCNSLMTSVHLSSSEIRRRIRWSAVCLMGLSKTQVDADSRLK